MINKALVRALVAVGAAGLLLVGVSQAALIDGLHAYYPLDSNSAGAGGITDESGNSRHGTGPIGAGLTTVAGKVGNAINFDGAGGSEIIIDQVPESDFDFENADFSVQAWFQVNAFDKSWQALVVKGEGGAWRMHRSGGSSDLAVNMGQGDTTTGNTLNDGQWRHIVGVHDAGVSTNIYVDGVLTATGSGAGPGNGGGLLTIGDNPDAGNRNWNGLIDEVAVWDRVLSPAEVTQLYNGGNGVSLTPIPEPSSIALAALGVLGIGLLGWQMRRRAV